VIDSFVSLTLDLPALGTHSLGERYGLRIIPGMNNFLVMPNNVSRSTAVAAILQPGGPIRSPPKGRFPWLHVDVFDTDYLTNQGVDFLLAFGNDEKLVRQLKELNNAETCSVSGRGTDAKWKIDPEDATKALWHFAEPRRALY
jgi:hypothetical protein